MRLVDADAIKQKYPNRKSLNQVLDAEPTAYEVDKVVDELEEITNDYVRYNPPMNDYENGFEDGCEFAFDKSVEIVKGGVNE